MILSIANLVSGLAFGFAAAMTFAVIWRRVAERRDRQGFVWSDTAGIALTFLTAWTFTVLSMDVPVVLVPFGFLLPFLLVGVEVVVSRRFAAGDD